MVFSRIDYFCNPAEPIADNSLSNDFSCRSFTGASNTGRATQLRDWSWVFDKRMPFTGWHVYQPWLNSCKIDSPCNTLPLKWSVIGPLLLLALRHKRSFAFAQLNCLEKQAGERSSRDLALVSGHPASVSQGLAFLKASRQYLLIFAGQEMFEA